MTWIKAFRREATVGIAPHACMSGAHLFRGDKCPRCRCPRRDRARRRRGAAFPGATPQLSRGNAFRPCARVCAPPYPPQRWRTLPLPWVDQRASARKVVHIWYYIWVITNSRRKRRERSSCFPSRRTPLPSFAGRNLSGLSWLLVEQRSGPRRGSNIWLETAWALASGGSGGIRYLQKYRQKLRPVVMSHVCHAQAPGQELCEGTASPRSDYVWFLGRLGMGREQSIAP